MPSFLPQDLNSKCNISSIEWDKACDLLAGSSDPTLSEIFVSSSLKTRFSSGRQFLFQDDPARLPLESFWLKLSAFASLCQRVSEFYQKHGHAYLSLDPTHARMIVTDHSFPWLPTRWRFSVELDDGLGARPIPHETMPKEMAQNLFVPFQEVISTYTSPVMRDWPIGREIPVTVLLRSIERIPDEPEDVTRGFIRAHLFSDVVNCAGFIDEDVMHITLFLPGGGMAAVSLWARKVESAERGLVVSGVTSPVPSAMWGRLERAKQQVFSDARAQVYRSLTHSCDLYSLGMLLFRALVVCESRPIQNVQHNIENILARLEPLVQGLSLEDHWTIHKRVVGRLKDAGVVFAPPSGTISEYVWYDALIFGLRLVSCIPGFGIAAEPSAPQSDALSAMRSAVGRAKELAEQARVDLFEATARYHDLLRVCDLALAERL
jgi:hypothetical protein